MFPSLTSAQFTSSQSALDFDRGINRARHKHDIEHESFNDDVINTSPLKNTLRFKVTQSCDHARSKSAILIWVRCYLGIDARSDAMCLHVVIKWTWRGKTHDLFSLVNSYATYKEVAGKQRVFLWVAYKFYLMKCEWLVPFSWIVISLEAESRDFPTYFSIKWERSTWFIVNHDSDCVFYFDSH